MAFDRGYVARQQIQAESCVGGDLYDFLDEKPPEPRPTLRQRAVSLPPGARSPRGSPLQRRSLDDRPPAAGGDSNTLEGPLIQPPLLDLYVFLGEAPPPHAAARRRDLDLRRAWAEVWWRFRSQRRRMEQSAPDESFGPSCDYQQLAEGPGGRSVTTQSTANSFRDFWLSLGGGPLSMDTGDASRQPGARRGTVPNERRGREAPVTGIAQRSRSVFEPRSSDRYHQLEGQPRRQEQYDDDLPWPEDGRQYWDTPDLEMLARMGDVPNLGFGPFTMY